MTKITKEESKKAMLRVRTYVKNFNKGKNPDKLQHLGEYPKTMADARRTIVALQDMLDDTKNRHKKASDNVEELKNEVDKYYRESFSSKKVITLLNELMQRSTNLLNAKITELTKTNQYLKNDLHKQVTQLNEERNKRRNTLSVLKSSLNGDV